MMGCRSPHFTAGQCDPSHDVARPSNPAEGPFTHLSVGAFHLFITYGVRRCKASLRSGHRPRYDREKNDTTIFV